MEQQGINVKTSCAKRLRYRSTLMKWLHIKGETTLDILLESGEKLSKE